MPLRHAGPVGLVGGGIVGAVAGDRAARQTTSHAGDIAKGTVPVLVLADGTVIEESLELMHWALSPDGSQGLSGCR